MGGSKTESKIRSEKKTPMITLFDVRELHEAPKVPPRVQKGSKMGSQSYGRRSLFGFTFWTSFQEASRNPPGTLHGVPRCLSGHQSGIKFHLIRSDSMQGSDMKLARVLPCSFRSLQYYKLVNSDRRLPGMTQHARHNLARVRLCKLIEVCSCKYDLMQTSRRAQYEHYETDRK